MKRWACIARLGGIGDNLVAASPLRVLKNLGYNTEIITSEFASCVFLNNPFLDKLSVKKEKDLPGGYEWQLWFESRSHEYDVFANLSNSMEGRHAIHKNETKFRWPAEYRRKICAGSYLETAHDIVGVPYDFGPLYFPTEEEYDVAARTTERIGPNYIAWIVRGSRFDKLYPFAPQAIARIIKELRIPVLIVGSNAQQHAMALKVKEVVEVANSDRDMLHIAVTHEGLPTEAQWGIRVGLNLIMNSSMVVTPDTGPAWAVALESMPKILLASHASPENITKHWLNTTTLHADPFRVPCWPCHQLHDDSDTCVVAKDVTAAACMADISVENIVRAVEKSWQVRDNVVPLREAVA